LRYIAEPRTWCRMAPFAEKDEILVTARVWHQHPPKVRPKKAKEAAVKAQSAASALPLTAPGAEESEAEETAQAEARPVRAWRAVARPLAARQTASPRVVSPAAGPGVPPSPGQVPEQVPVPERAPARRAPSRAKAEPVPRPSWSPWPYGPEPDTASGPDTGQTPAADQRPAWATPPPPAELPEA